MSKKLPPAQGALFTLRESLGLGEAPKPERLTIPPQELVISDTSEEELRRNAKAIGISIQLVGRLHDPTVLKERVEKDGRMIFQYRVIAGRSRVYDAIERGEAEIDCVAYSHLTDDQQDFITLTEGASTAGQKLRKVAAFISRGWDDEKLDFMLEKGCQWDRHMAWRYIHLAHLPPHLFAYLLDGKISQTIGNQLTGKKFTAEKLAILEDMAERGEDITAKTLHDLFIAQTAKHLSSLMDEPDEFEQADIAEDEDDPIHLLDELERRLSADPRHTGGKARSLLNVARRMIESERNNA